MTGVFSRVRPAHLRRQIDGHKIELGKWGEHTAATIYLSRKISYSKLFINQLGVWKGFTTLPRIIPNSCNFLWYFGCSESYSPPIVLKGHYFPKINKLFFFFFFWENNEIPWSKSVVTPSQTKMRLCFKTMSFKLNSTFVEIHSVFPKAQRFVASKWRGGRSAYWQHELPSEIQSFLFCKNKISMFAFFLAHICFRRKNLKCRYRISSWPSLCC